MPRYSGSYVLNPAKAENDVFPSFLWQGRDEKGGDKLEISSLRGTKQSIALVSNIRLLRSS